MHYEKLGVGSNRGFEYTNLNILHNQLYFFNFQVVNSLGFTNILSSDPILTDFTPPTPTFCNWENSFNLCCKIWISELSNGIKEYQ